MEEFEKRIVELTTAMWKTAGSRFLAASRLSQREKLSTLSIASLSVVATMVGLLDAHAGNAAQRIGLSVAVLSALMSLLVLVISLVAGFSQDAVQSHKLHESAMHISEVRRRLVDLLARCKSEKQVHWGQYDTLRSSYDTYLRECPFNHETIDFRRFEAQHRLCPEFCSGGKPGISWLESGRVRAAYFLSSAWLSIVACVTVASLALLTF